jgi:hypothetical protein
LLAAQNAEDKIVVEDNKLEKILGTQNAVAYDQQIEDLQDLEEVDDDSEVLGDDSD